MGIEPTSEAWEASILPLYDARSIVYCTREVAARKVVSLFARSWRLDRTTASPLLTGGGALVSVKRSEAPPGFACGPPQNDPGRRSHCRIPLLRLRPITERTIIWLARLRA
jgi:hypothetical protein